MEPYVTIISCLNSSSFEIFIHEDCALHPSSEKSFCWSQHNSSKRLPSQKNLLFLAWGLGIIVSQYKEVWFSVWFQIGSHEVFGSILTCCNSSCLFFVGLQFYGFVLSITSSSLLWKVTTSSTSFFGNSTPFRLFECTILALLWKTYSICFFMFLITIVSILQ